MLRHFAFMAATAAAFAMGFSLVFVLAGAPPAPGTVVELDLDPAMQISTRDHFGPAMMRRDRHAAAAKSDRETRRSFDVAKAPQDYVEPLPYEPGEAAPMAPGAPSLTKLVAFSNAPFPYSGRMPRNNRPFLNYKKDGRVGHRTGFGRLYWADKTYSDNRVLLHIPQTFDKTQPGVMVVFFHGHGATLQRDVMTRQQVPAQISASGLNAVLVAPQLAVNARDSAAGNLWTRDGASRFLDEAATKLAELNGDPSARDAFANMPIILVGYSGGYVPTAWSLARGGLGDRVQGVVLLDGLYGELDKFARWIAKDSNAFFLSAYAGSTKWRNQSLKQILAARNIRYRTRLASRLSPGSVTFIEANVRHRNYVTHAWADYPIADMLKRLPTTIKVARHTHPATLAAIAP